MTGPVHPTPASPEPSWHGVEPSPTAGEEFGEPFPRLHQLRERAPVHPTPGGYWRLCRYRDCVRLLRDVPTGVRRSDGRLPQRSDDSGQFMLQRDPPDHTRLRKLVSKAFTPRAVEGWRERAREVADECVNRLIEAGGGDVVSGLALPVPATLICEMLGVPLADRDRFTTWTADATHALSGELTTPELQGRAQSGAGALASYFEALIAERRRQPGDDLLTVLIRAEEDGDRLSPDELLVQCIGLLIAGFETTIGLIANGTVALCRHPDQQKLLRDDPGSMPNAVDELLRYDGPVGATVRVMHADAEIGGFVIPKDAWVFAMIRAANRDPEVFADPDRLDVTRKNAREHLAFGGGTHFCLGSHLARMETEVAVGTLLARTRELALASDRIDYGRSLFRVPARLPVVLERA